MNSAQETEMADTPKNESDHPRKDQFLDNLADVNDTPDVTALKASPKNKIGRPNEERRAKQLLDRIGAIKKPAKPTKRA
jgi:hypothetical protein